MPCAGRALQSAVRHLAASVQVSITCYCLISCFIFETESKQIYIGSNIAENRYPAFLHLTDIAGLIKGASEGAGLGNAFLSHIQAVDGIFHMVRAFDSTEVVHVSSLLVQKPLRVASSVCVFLVVIACFALGYSLCFFLSIATACWFVCVCLCFALSNSIYCICNS